MWVDRVPDAQVGRVGWELVRAFPFLVSVVSPSDISVPALGAAGSIPMSCAGGAVSVPHAAVVMKMAVIAAAEKLRPAQVLVNMSVSSPVAAHWCGPV